MIGQKIGNYIIQAKIGSGAMGTVLLGRHKSLGTPAAIKAITAAHAHDADFALRFAREAQVQARLTHPNIARVLDHVEKDGRWYLICEYMAGGSLEEKLDERPLAIDRAVTWAREALFGLDHAHRNGIIHRDVKPANILINDQGQAAVTDFGIAIEIGGTRLTRVGTPIGTPEYMSPEQVVGGAIDHRTDVYAMGAVLYELIAGQPPFVSESPFEVQRAHTSDPPPPLAALRPDIEPALDAVIGRALAKAPADRFAGCGAFAHALEPWSVAGGERAPASQPAPTSPPEPPEDPKEKPEKRGRPRRILTGALTLLVALVVATGGSFLGGLIGGNAEPIPPALLLAVERARSEAAVAGRQADRAERAAAQSALASREAIDNAASAESANHGTTIGRANDASHTAATRAASSARTAADAAHGADRAATAAAETADQVRSLVAAVPQQGDQHSVAEPLIIRLARFASSAAFADPGDGEEAALAAEADLAAVDARSAADRAASAAASAAQATTNAVDAAKRAQQALDRWQARPALRPPPPVKPIAPLPPPSPGPSPPPSLPATPSVAVIVVGEHSFAIALEGALEKNLRAASFPIIRARNASAVSRHLAGNEKPDAHALARATEHAGAHVLVFAHVGFISDREIKVLGRRDRAIRSRIRLDAYSTAGGSLGGGWGSTLEYTENGAPAMASKLARDVGHEIAGTIWRTWNAQRR